MPLIFRRYFYAIIQSYSIPFSAQMLAIAINFTFWFSGFLGENMPWTHISHSTAHDFLLLLLNHFLGFVSYAYIRNLISKKGPRILKSDTTAYNWSRMNVLLKQLFTNYYVIVSMRLYELIFVTDTVSVLVFIAFV